MKYQISTVVPIDLHNHDGTIVPQEKFASKLDGLACATDSVLAYVELDFAGECDLRGGHLRLRRDDAGNLVLSVEIDSQRKLSRNELRAFREDLEGQLTDGIGASGFDDLARSSGLTVELRFPVRIKMTQSQGVAWRPKATTESGNLRRIAAAAKLVERMDASPSERTTSKAKPARKSPETSPQSQGTRPNLKKLFRLLAKVERDKLVDEIKAELEKCGNDLSTIVDGELPYGNLSSPKLLKILLKAGLPIETTDEKGHSLLIQAACEPKCLTLLLELGAEVNRNCHVSFASTALIRAARLGKLRAVECLLKHGADPSIKDASGKSAMEVVDKHARDRDAIVKLLENS